MQYIPQASYLDRGRRPQLRRATLVTTTLLGFGIAACGGPSTAGVATGSTTTTASPSGGGSTQATEQVAYSSCMRSHGVPNFPDPSGGNSKRAVVNALQAVSNSQAQAAENACQHLVPAGVWPGGPVQAITAQQQSDYLKAAACMRSHGITNFPDPTFSNGQVNTNIPSSIDQNSLQFTQAAQICTKMIPAGLPYSNGSGQ